MAVAREIEDIERSLVRHQHDHPPVRDLNRETDQREGTGQRVADELSRMVGSWAFVIVQLLLVVVWVALNVYSYHWDKYPFLFLNLVLTLQALLAAALVVMAQNRTQARERLRAEHDYEVNVKSEEELKSLMNHLESQDEVLLQVLQRLDRSDRELRKLMRRVGLTD
jgi:uncharacterized membrane protein